MRLKLRCGCTLSVMPYGMHEIEVEGTCSGHSSYAVAEYTEMAVINEIMYAMISDLDTVSWYSSTDRE